VDFFFELEMFILLKTIGEIIYRDSKNNPHELLKKLLYQKKITACKKRLKLLPTIFFTFLLLFTPDYFY